MAWMRYTTASIRYVFVSVNEEARMSQTRQLCSQIHAYLHLHGTATRSELNSQCLKGRVPKARIDAAIEHLLTMTPPSICIDLITRPNDSPGTPTRVYRLA